MTVSSTAGRAFLRPLLVMHQQVPPPLAAPDVRVLALVRGAVCVLQDAILYQQVPRAREAVVADGQRQRS